MCVLLEIEHNLFHLYSVFSGVSLDISPYQAIVADDVDSIQVELSSLSSGSVNALSYMMLSPSSSIHSYLRMVCVHSCVHKGSIRI